MRFLFLLLLVTQLAGVVLASPIAPLLTRYAAFATARPIASNVIQGGVLFTGGDIIAQAAQPEQDPSRQSMTSRCQRALCSGAFGAVYTGLAVAQWYRLMDHVVSSHLGKVAANCVGCGIVGNTANMFCRRMARTRDSEEAWEFTKGHIKPVVLHDFKVWPVFDYFCFGVVPRHLRPATAGVASLVWNIYMSVTSNSHS